MSGVKIDADIDDFLLDEKTLFPLGVIFEELVTNAFKYAFGGKETGEIKIRLSASRDTVRLDIQDNGTGLPAGFDLNSSNYFGFMIVRLLCDQLDGEFSIENHNGTKCMISFPRIAV